MPERERRIPGPDHPITIEAHDGRVTVRVGGTVVADTTAALELHEAGYPVMYYLPIGDVDRSLLRPSETSSYCPYKGEAAYHGLGLGDTNVDDVLWYYPEPYDAVARIEGHVAFYPDKVELAA